MKKTRSEKSRDTVPLMGQYHEIVFYHSNIYWIEFKDFEYFYFGLKLAETVQFFMLFW
jgi:hypothetical protein